MTKYCVLPGREPVRLASTDGHIIIIGETPRPIPEQFILDAKAKGCLTEDEVKALAMTLAVTTDLSGTAEPVTEPTTEPVSETTTEPEISILPEVAEEAPKRARVLK